MDGARGGVRARGVVVRDGGGGGGGGDLVRAAVHEVEGDGGAGVDGYGGGKCVVPLVVDGGGGDVVVGVAGHCGGEGERIRGQIGNGGGREREEDNMGIRNGYGNIMKI